MVASMNTLKEPHPKLKALTKFLTGKWRVKGHEIEGEAEYKSLKNNSLLVGFVDFTVGGSPMKVMQHITYDQATDTLQAHYMDTMGDRSIYIWQLDDHTMRVSHNSKDSGTYFEATFNHDYSEYTGIWHYPIGDNPEPEKEKITYTKMK